MDGLRKRVVGRDRATRADGSGQGRCARTGGANFGACPMTLVEKARVSIRRLRPVDRTASGLARSIDGHGAARSAGLRQRISELTRVLIGDTTPIGRRWTPVTAG